ncbi:MAG TPA: ATP-binding protein [Planctomycetota bacterium]|nr:ATP-binding protein [Planctomycetota bacterium]
MDDPAPLSTEVIQILKDLNPWWDTGKLRREPHPYHRRGVRELIHRLSSPKGLIEILRGPRQVGKTTALEQIVSALLDKGTRPTDILFVRFDQEVIQERAGGLVPVIRWFTKEIRKRPLEDGDVTLVLLDEVHKLPKWADDVKHVGDTFPLRMVLTGSSSVLVAKGGRESLAGRVFTTEMPTFQFREVVEAWTDIGARLPAPHAFHKLYDPDPEPLFRPFHDLRPQARLTLRRHLERYFNRGGYPRLHNGEVGDDLWSEYLTETIFSRVLGVDVPDLFPVRNPQLLRWLYVEIARSTGQEVSQNRLAEFANEAGFRTSQPHVGNYVHYLADALLIREFRRYPLSKRESARTPSKITLTDLGARTAVFRVAPSLWESPPDTVSPLIETLVQSVLRGPGIDVRFFRDYENSSDRRSPLKEVDFVLEDAGGQIIPVEVKFRGKLDSKDFSGLECFMKRFKPSHGIMVTRDTWEWNALTRILCVPLLDFLLAF